MSQFLDLYGFLAVLIHGINLALEAVAIGGIIFLLACLDADSPWRQSCRGLLRWSSVFLALGALGSAFLAALVLHSSATDFTWLDLAQTTFAWSGLLVAAAAAILAVMAARSRAVRLLAPGAVLIGASILLSHAFARVDGRPALLSITALHRVATAAWIGGLPYLLLVLSQAQVDSIQPIARRFSRVAAASATLLLGAGLFLGWKYAGNLGAVYGTSYGVMLGAKALLFGLLLLLGASNFLLLRPSRWLDTFARLRMRRVVECEVALGFTAILAAASLTSQPPAIDLKAGRVSADELVARFTPRWPRLKTPSLALLSPVTPLNSEEAQRFQTPLSFVPGSSYQESNQADIEWSEFNHNWAGMCVVLAGVLAILAQAPRMRWARHWPLAFLGLALFVLIRADAENWPLGPRGFWESFQVAEVAQHRILSTLIGFAAIFEWRVAQKQTQRKWSPLIFPLVCMAGGALLLTHTHPLGNIKEQLLAEISHTSIALLAVIAAIARWLELRLLRKPAGLGFVWAACLLTIGLTLVFYRES